MGIFDVENLTLSLAESAQPEQTFSARYPLYGGLVELLYDKAAHSYFVRISNEVKPVAGVTSITKMLDKPALLPWAVKLCAEYIIERITRVSYLKDGDPTQRRLPDLDFDQVIKWITEAKADYRNVSKTALDVGHEVHEWLEAVQKSALEHKTTVQVVVDSGAFPLPVFTADVAGFDEQLAKQMTAEAARNTEHTQNGCKAAIDWMARHNFRPLHVENKVYSRLYNYAGTFDDIALVNSCDDPDAECCSVLHPGGRREHLHFTDLKVLSDWKSSKGMYDEYRFQTAAYKEAWEEENGEELGGRIVVKLGKDDGKFAAFFLPNSDQTADFGSFIGLQTVWERIEDVKTISREFKDLSKALKAAEKAAAKDAAKAEKDADKALKAAEKAAKAAKKATVVV